MVCAITDRTQVVEHQTRWIRMIRAADGFQSDKSAYRVAGSAQHLFVREPARVDAAGLLEKLRRSSSAS